MSNIDIQFWGVRGSIPAPLTGKGVEDKVVQAIVQSEFVTGRTPDQVREWARKNLPFEVRSTFGGNTTCVEIKVGDKTFICDMGTGIRELGIARLGETIKNKGFQATVLQSHMHWDHIQGYPFFPQIFMPRGVFNNRLDFYGGMDWSSTLEDVLRGQMNPPLFPVDHRELEKVAVAVKFGTVYDGWNTRFVEEQSAVGLHNPITVKARKLNHPQETYGYRIENAGRSVAFCTDHEPFGGTGLHRGLLDLVSGVDVFITDCQYSHDEYAGTGGKVQKFGWGHSYPEYIAAVAREAKPKKVITTHHDPTSSDDRILELARQVQDLSGIETVAAYEGLIISI